MVLVEQGKLTQKEAAKEMGLSVRQARRVLKRYRQSDLSLESLAYQRRHPAPNALPNSVKEDIWRLHQEYPHWSCPAITEALAASEGAVVHRSTVYRLLRQEVGRRLPRQRRPAFRFQMRASGELWQMDTTIGAWLEGYRRVCVVVILDDYSRAVVAARVFPPDSVEWCDLHSPQGTLPGRVQGAVAHPPGGADPSLAWRTDGGGAAA